MNFNLFQQNKFMFVTKPELKVYLDDSSNVKKDKSCFLVKRDTITTETSYHYQNTKDKLALILTGSKSNITVVDIDHPKIYKKLLKKYPALSDVFTVKTYHGYHMYFFIRCGYQGNSNKCI